MTTIREAFETMAWGPAPESAAAAQAWLDKHGRAFGHFINGAWCAPAGGARLATVNPANGVEIAQVARGSTQDVDAAVAAARGPSSMYASRSSVASSATTVR